MCIFLMQPPRNRSLEASLENENGAAKASFFDAEC